MNKIQKQAFGYKSAQKGCRYVIISNYEKLRFYIDDETEFEEFDLFKIAKNNKEEQFKKMYLIFNKENIFKDLPLTMKKETKFHEQEVSNKLYKDYSSFKRKLYDNMVKNNPEIDKLVLFKKSQKLLDRFLFILFTEDSGALRPNLITEIIERPQKALEVDIVIPLYDAYKQFFEYINTGSSRFNIPAYNVDYFTLMKFLID